MYVKQQTNITLPNNVMIKLPYADQKTATKIKQEYTNFLHTVPYPKPIRNYLRDCIHVPYTTSTKLTYGLCADKITLGVEEMSTILKTENDMCGCKNGKITSNPQCEKKAIHTDEEKIEVFGETHKKLMQANLNRTIMPSPQVVERGTAEELEATKRLLPKLRPFKFQKFKNATHKITNAHVQDLDRQKMVTAQDVKNFKENFPDWVPVRLDKNAACYAILRF